MDDGSAYVDVVLLGLHRSHLNYVWLGLLRVLGAFDILIRRLSDIWMRLGGSLRLLTTVILICIAGKKRRRVSGCIELDSPALIGSNSRRVFDILLLDRLDIEVVQHAGVALSREDTTAFA